MGEDYISMHYVYILSNGYQGETYIGSTNDIVRRVYEHKQKVRDGFTSRNSIAKLVYFEEFESYRDAALREKKLKKWLRDWKVDLIETSNPEWSDLYYGLV